MLSLIALAVLTGSSAAPMAAQEGRTWVCKKPYLYGINAWGNMAEGTWMKEFSVSASGVSFTDPAGQGSGSASWEGPPLVLKEGQKVEISMQASKMLASFTALRCADNKLAFSKGVRDPWNPPVSSASFSFEFTPAKGVDKVTMRIEAKPTEGGPFYSCGGGVAWTFEPGSASDVVEQGATLSAVDARTWHDKGGFRLPAKVEGTPSMMGTYLNDGAPLRGVAADGVSLVLLRASVGKEGKATFDVSGAGGALYPMVGENPLRSPGSRTLAVETRRIASDKHAAFALYRPPSYFGSGKDEPDVVFGVQFGGGAKTIHKIKLVRPPVVLVHGTYDNPRYCWEEHDAASEAPTNLAPRLRAAGFKDVFCVDWEETNGHKDPSDFETNRFTVFSNKDGIRDALNAMRGRQIAVTQADLVCHSQGGVISRMYARGYPFSFGLPADHPHLNDPENCKSGTQPCWYHRAENYWAGDIHRIVTISTTHRGSHVCNLFPALDAFPVKSVSSAFSKLALSMFLNVVDYGFSAITTGGFYNQQPMSLELRSMGPTPVPAHAIACVGTDQDMLKTRPGVHGMGDYYFKLYLVLTSTPNDAQFFAFDKIAEHAQAELDSGHLKDPRDIERLKNVKADVAEYKRLVEQNLKALANNLRTHGYRPNTSDAVETDRLVFLIRKIVFMGDENDCTVAQHSSWGGLDAKYRSTAEHVMHGWAPRYLNVQNKVLELLTSAGGQFDPNGFPGAYSGIKSKASNYNVTIPPQGLPVATDTTLGSTGTTGGTGSTGSTTTGSSTPAGAAGGIPSVGGWTPLTEEGTKVTVSGEAITFEVPKTSEGRAIAFAKQPLAGDMELVVDFDIEGWRQDLSLTLKIYLSAKPNTEEENIVEVSLTGPSPDDSTLFLRPGNAPAKMANYSGSSKGKLRVEKLAGVYILGLWNGTAWQSVATVQSNSLKSAYIGFSFDKMGAAASAKAVLRPSLKGGKAAARTEPGQPAEPKEPVKEKPLHPGTLVLESVSVDLSSSNFKDQWVAKENGTAVWNSPWFTVTYKINAPKVISAEGAEITVEAHMQAKPGQRGTVYVKFFDGEYVREPFDREFAFAVEPGQEKKDVKTWKLKPYNAQADTVTIPIGLGDGPMYIFKYRTVKK